MTDTVDVIYIASNKEETNPGASGQVQDHQEHHRDDQEQLLDNFLEGFYKVLRRFKRLNKVLIRNFKRLVSETMALYRHEAKTRNRYHLGASFEGLIIWIMKELEAPRRKNRFLVKFVFSPKVGLKWHPNKWTLQCCC